MGLLDKLVPQSLKSLFEKPQEQVTSAGYRTFTEHAPAFSPWDSGLYEQAQTRAIIECIATACSKLKPEFVTPDGSGGSLPRVQRLFTSWPNDLMTWPVFLKRITTLLLTETTTYIVPGYDPRDGSITSLWPLKPSYAEVVEYKGEPWMRFRLATGEVQAFPFYDVGILTRFQYESDIFGSGNIPLTPTLRLMDAQRQAEEIALKTGADIRFIGKLSGMVHERDMEKKRSRFSETNLSPRNKTGLMLFDQTFENITPLKSENFTIDPEEMERINKALYAYFGINEKILFNEYSEDEWAAFYEGCIESKAILYASVLDKMLLTPTQRRKGNHVMFSSSYLEYASTNSKIKVANLLTTTGTGTRNEVRDIFQLPRLPSGDLFLVRGEYYAMDLANNIIAESGGRTEHTSEFFEDDDLSDIDEPDGTNVLDDVDEDEVTRLSRQLTTAIIRKRLGPLELGEQR